MEWVALLSQPITQFVALVAVAVGLQKNGVDVFGFVRWLFEHRSAAGVQSGSGESREYSADIRNALQPLLSSMDQLLLHFNHETTDNQNKIISMVEHLHDKTDQTVQLLREIKEYGIKCRKE